MTSGARPVAIVVDDDALIRMAAVDILADEGFDTLEAEDGDAAIALLEGTSGVTLLFSDVQMPGTRDGFALAREVAARWPAIGIVIASGDATPGDVDLPRSATFIRKPFSAEIVREHMHKVLAPEQKPRG